MPLIAEMLAELRDIFKKIEQDKNIYAVIITGAGGKVFCGRRRYIGNERFKFKAGA